MRLERISAVIIGLSRKGERAAFGTRETGFESLRTDARKDTAH